MIRLRDLLGRRGRPEVTVGSLARSHARFAAETSDPTISPELFDEALRRWGVDDQAAQFSVAVGAAIAEEHSNGNLGDLAIAELLAYCMHVGIAIGLDQGRAA